MPLKLPAPSHNDRAFENHAKAWVKRWAGLGAMLIALGSGGASAQTPDVAFVPHHAAYKLTLARSTGDKAPAAASGLISYDFTGSSCEGYATAFRQMTEIQPAEGESRVSDMRSATFEDGGAKQYRFNTHTTYSSGPEDELNGTASKQADGTVAVSVEKPKASKKDLSAALFPTEHLRKIVDSARQGRKLLTEAVYDGSESGLIIYDTLAVIGAPIEGQAPEKPAGVEQLKATRRWPVSISYFERGRDNAQPNYVLSFDLYENGISRALKLDYGTFVLVGELVDLQIQPVPACKN